MKVTVLIVSVVSCVIGGAATFAVIQWIGKGSSELAFVIGAIVGTQAGAIIHYRQKGAKSSLAVKAKLGLAVGGANVVFGVVLHYAIAPFAYAEVTIPLAAVGGFVFPFVLFDTMWNALSKYKDA
ncbi:MAG: hypothetical protein H8E53_00215 [Planctomycetes bacterium]|nr:hypothetical protein [Planctomycetota bacterium]